MELPVAPLLGPALPIGGGEGAFCDDCGVLVIDEVSNGVDVPVRHGRLLALCYIVRLFLQAKSGGASPFDKYLIEILGRLRYNRGSLHDCLEDGDGASIEDQH